MKGIQKQAANSVLRAQAALNSSAREEMIAGFERNIWGSYWSSEAIEDLLSILTELQSNSRHEEEWFASTLRLAGFAREARRFDRARSLYLQIIDRVPAKAYVAMKWLAYVEANAGNIDAAKGWAKMANEFSPSVAFRVSGSELASEAGRT